MAVSYSASPEVRRAQLSPLFIRLISDPCRWVSAGRWAALAASHRGPTGLVVAPGLVSLRLLIGVFRPCEGEGA